MIFRGDLLFWTCFPIVYAGIIVLLSFKLRRHVLLLVKVYSFSYVGLVLAYCGWLMFLTRGSFHLVYLFPIISFALSLFAVIWSLSRVKLFIT